MPSAVSVACVRGCRRIYGDRGQEPGQPDAGAADAVRPDAGVADAGAADVGEPEVRTTPLEEQLEAGGHAIGGIGGLRAGMPGETEADPAEAPDHTGGLPSGSR